jgi:hypothetical protein
MHAAPLVERLIAETAAVEHQELEGEEETF